MINFKDVEKNEIKAAYSIKTEDRGAYVKFTADGKTYKYRKDKILILDNGIKNSKSFIIYSIQRECWKCHKMTEILTYITYADNPDEDVVYPWDRARLLKSQNFMAHMVDSSIEYYGLHVIGDIDSFDQILMDKFPDKIKRIYSNTENEEYPMNVCSSCGAKQGRYFVYKLVNEYIKNMKEIDKLKQ